MRLRKYFYLKSKKLSRKSMLITLLMIMILLAAAILIVNQEVIHQKIYRSVGTTISDWVAKETNGLYVLTYDSMKINTLREQITLNNISFRPDSSKLMELKNKGQLPRDIYELVAPQLFLDIASVWKVMFEDKLEFNGIYFNKPALTIHNVLQADSSTSLSLESGDLYLKINKYLDKFNINEFKLLDGSVSYKRLLENDQREYSVDNIDVYIDNLRIDATKKTTGTDRVRVILKKPSFTLADNIHRLEMDSLLLDSKNQTLLLNEVVIFPVYEKLQTENIDGINLYNFTIPNIRLEGVDFAKAYRENKLDIERIYIPHPEIIFDTHKKNKKGAKTSDNNLIKQLSVLFNSIHTSEFILENGKMDFAIEANDKLRNLRIQNTSVNIKDLSLDTLEYSHNNSHINFRSFDVKLENYHLILPDSIHQMTAEAIVYSSDSAELTITNIKIDPSDKIYLNKNTFSARIPEVKLENLSADEYLKEHKITIETININDPTVVFHNIKRNDSVPSTILNFAFKNNKFTDYITARNININNINFDLREKEKIKTRIVGGTLALAGFHISENLPTKPNTYFNSSNVSFYFPKLNFFTANTEEIELSGVSGSITTPFISMKGMKYITMKSYLTIDGQNITAKGLHLQKIINGDKIVIDSLFIEQATLVKTTNKKESKKDNSEAVKSPPPININFVRLRNGSLRIISPKDFNTDITGINGFIQGLTVSEKGIHSTNYKLNTEDLLLHSEEKNVQIGAAKAEIHKDKLIFYLPYIKPVHANEDYPVSINSTQAVLLDFKLENLINDKKLHAREFKMLSTNIDITGQNSSAKNKARSVYIDWENLLKDKIKEIIIGRVIMSGPGLAFEANGGELEMENYEIELRKFNTNSDGTRYLLNSDNIRAKTTNFTYEKDNLLVSAGEISLDENTRLILVEELMIKNHNSTVNIPLIFAKELNLKKLAEEDKLIGEELDISGFSIKYTMIPESDDMQTVKLPLIQFKKVTAHEGVMNVINKDGEELKINNIRWLLTDFDTEKNLNQPFYSEKLNVRAGMLTGLINNKMDRILVSEMSLTENGTFKIEHIYLKPEFDKMKYAYEVGHETDWINLVIDDVVFSGIDLNKIFEAEPAYLIKRGSIKKLKANIYRDKKLPLPQNKKAALPQQSLKEMRTTFALDSFRIHSADITYQELSELAFEPGELQFQDLDILIENVTNIPSRLDVNNNMVVTIDGKVEGSSLFSKAVFDLTSPKNEFIFSGKLGEGDLVKFNKILENNVFLKIEKGNSKGLTFNIKADNESALGKMQFHYRNLKVSIIDKQTNKTSGIDESIISFFANTFVINSNNPSLFVLKEGNIYYPRDVSKSIFNYWAKSFLSGVLSSIGMKSNKKELKEALSGKNKD